MLRKSMMATMVAMMLVLVIAAAALAQGPGLGAGVGTPGTGTCINGADNDGDGVCDNWIDGDGNGVNDLAPQDGYGSQYGQHGVNLQTSTGVQAQAQSATQQANYIDANEDGVCDNFDDADGNGVNDGSFRIGPGGQTGRRSR